MKNFVMIMFLFVLNISNNKYDKTMNNINVLKKIELK